MRGWQEILIKRKRKDKDCIIKKENQYKCKREISNLEKKTMNMERWNHTKRKWCELNILYS